MSRAMFLFISTLIHLLIVLLIFNFSLQTNLNQTLEIGFSEIKQQTEIKNSHSPDAHKDLAYSKNKTEQNAQIDSTDTAPLQTDQASPSPLLNQSAEAEYESYIFQEISKRKSYPALARKLRQSGQILIQISIANDGRVLSAKIFKKSQSELLNQEIERLLTNLTEFKKFPESIHKDSWSFIIPIEFRLQN